MLKNFKEIYSSKNLDEHYYKQPKNIKEKYKNIINEH